MSTKTVNEALRLNKNNGNHLWRDGITKEINAVMIELKLLDGGEKPPTTYRDIKCNMNFDIKMEDFRQKARYVAGGHVTVAPTTLTDAGVLS